MRTRVLLAATAVAATAFAPVPTTSSAPTFTLVTDTDDATVQPVVLLLGSDVDADEAYSTQPTPGAFAYATADLGCGDLGGPADVAALGALVDELLTDARTSDRLAIEAREVAALQALALVSTPAGAASVAALLVDDPYTDPHTVLFSEGGVARAAAPLVGTAPSLPCPTDGATDGTRDAWWAERDVTARLDAITTPLWVEARSAGGVPTAQALALAPVAAATDGALLVDPNEIDPGDTAAARRQFLAQHLLDASGREDHRRYSGQRTSAPDTCVGPACLTRTEAISRLRRVPTPGEVSLFVNRTFEQDLDCVPVCVPGPGTGEIGSLELVNRFETPHAPVFTWVDAGANTGRVTGIDPLNEGRGLNGADALPGGHGYHSLAFHTGALDDHLHLLGEVRLEGFWNTGRAGGTITPLLFAERPTTAGADGGRTVLLTSGSLDLDLAADRGERAHVGGWKAGTVVFDAVDTLVPEGWRLLLVLQSHDVEQFAPGQPQGLVNVATGPVDGITAAGTMLHLPVATPFEPSFDFPG